MTPQRATTSLATPGLALVAAAAIWASALLAGCASPWQQNFVPESWARTGPPPSPLPADATVQLRSAPWERVQSAQADFDAQVVHSDTRPEEWPPDKKVEARAALLRGLQISADPASVGILGHSSFRSTTLLRPETDASAARDLEKFARQVGADTVVWSRSLLGQTESIVDQPVTTHTSGDISHLDPRSRRFHSTTYNESTTTWVPVAIQENEYGYVAFFLNQSPPPAR